MRRVVGNLAIEIVNLRPFATFDRPGFLLIVAGAAVDAGPGTLIYQPEWAFQRLRFGAPGGTVIHIDLNDSRLRGLGPNRGHLPDLAIIRVRIRSALKRTDAAAALALRSAALHVVAKSIRTFRKLDRVPGWLIDARRAIEMRACEGIRPTDVASAAGVKVGRLAKAFRREFGLSVSEAIRTARVEAGVALLLQCRESTSAVARRCGFYDASHFIRSLEAATGLRTAALRDQR